MGKMAIEHRLFNTKAHDEVILGGLHKEDETREVHDGGRKSISNYSRERGGSKDVAICTSSFPSGQNTPTRAAGSRSRKDNSFSSARLDGDG